MNVYFLVRSFNDRSESEPFSILELSNSKDWLRSMMTAYVKQFVDDHEETIDVEESEDSVVIKYNWTDDEEEHSCTFAIIGGRSELFFHHEE